LSISLHSQADVQELVEKGIKLHDSGEYDLAIRTYQKALKLDPESELVNYELALSYLELKEYKKTIKHTDVVLKQKSKFSQGAYVIKGSALDMQGKTKKSIALFKKALKETGEDYLLYYNLALNYFKLGDYKNAEENAINAIYVNPNHASSHLLLANMHYIQENPVQTLLASYYFLFLEPNTTRSDNAFELLEETFGSKISKDKDDPKVTTINLSTNSEFATAELSISMIKASTDLEKNELLTDAAKFELNTKSFFSIMGGLNNENKKDIWWSFYTPFFDEIAESEHLSTYCSFISQGSGDKFGLWFHENEAAVKKFSEWVEEN